MWWRWCPPQVQVFLVARQQCGTIDSCEPVFWLLISRQKGGSVAKTVSPWFLILQFICRYTALCPVHHVLSPWANVRCFLATCRPSWWVSHLFLCYITIFVSWCDSSVHLYLIWCTFMRTGHICGVVCCVLQLVFGFSPRATAWTDVRWCSGSISLLLYQIALTWGVEHQTRFNYLPAQPQTLRSPHPPDNFCQILLARQEALDGEGQWSREGWRRRSKSSGITYIWSSSERDKFSVLDS